MEFHANHGHLCKPDGRKRNSKYKLQDIAEERKEKETSENTDKDKAPRVAAGRNSTPYLTHAKRAAFIG